MIKMSDITEETLYKCHKCKKFIPASQVMRKPGSIDAFCPRCSGDVEKCDYCQCD